MGGGGQTTSQSGPKVPFYELPLLYGGAGALTQADYGAGSQIPSLQGLYSGAPLQQTPPLTPGQGADIGEFQNIAARGGVGMGYESTAGNNLAAISNPQIAQQAFEQFAAPEVMQQSVLAGQGQSGAVPYALSQAAIPYELQAQNMQMQAANSLGALGGQLNQEQQQALQNALSGQNMQYDVNQQAAQNLYNQQQQKWKYAQGLQTFPFQLLGSAIGGGNTTVSPGSKF